MARPFINKLGPELEQIFNESGNDPEILKALYEELDHRTKSKMGKLKDRVQEQILATSVNKTKPVTNKNEDTIPLIQASAGNIISGGRRKKQENGYKDPYEEMNRVPPGVARIRPSGNLTGVPSKFQFDLKSDVQLGLNESATLLVRYEAGLKALIIEMRKKGAGAQQVSLENGVKIKVDGHDVGYQFPFDGEVDLFEGAKVDAIIGVTRAEGQIAAVFGKKLILGLQDDFGPHISHCVLKVDNTAMLEALRSRLEKIGKQEESGFNETIAKAVVGNIGQDQLSGSLPEKHLEGLNAKQREAACRITTNEVFYLWGPPGTGKTETLSAVNLALFDANKKVLLCSNTNQAVDQVLLKLCKKFGKNHPALEEGKIVRVGKIVQSELEDDWSEYVTLDGIVERKSVELKKQKEQLESELDRINQQAETTLKIFRRFKHLDQLESQQEDLNRQTNNLNQQVKNSEKQKVSAVSKHSNLRAELEKVRKKGILNFFSRSTEVVEKDIDSIRSELKIIEATIAEYRQKIHAFRPQNEALKGQVDQLSAALSKHDQIGRAHV